ncbi:MAG TPA: DUF819 family protein [Candidatus Obscuribacterales bacterium]
MLAAVSIFLYVLIILGTPAVAGWAAERSKLLNTLGPVVLCYLTGIVLALFGLPLLGQVGKTASEALVPLAIPLLLMGRNLWVEVRQTGRGLQAFGLACLSVCLVSFCVGWLFTPILPDAWKLAGMLIGVYTGSMTNMVSVGTALEVEQNHFVLIQAADVFTGGIFLLLMLSVMKPFLLLFLKPYQGEQEDNAAIQEHTAFDWRDARAWRDVGIGLLVSALIAGASVGISLAFLGKISVPLVMCLLTALGLGASAWPRINHLRGTDAAGDYLIQAFCVAIGCQVQLSELFSSSGPILIFTTIIMLGSIGLHLILARIFGHDADTTLIASTATIYGPPFIAPVAEAMGNRALIGPGLTLAVLGSAIGTWLGLGVAYGLKALL